jgi:hypothetical protein
VLRGLEVTHWLVKMEFAPTGCDPRAPIQRRCWTTLSSVVPRGVDRGSEKSRNPDGPNGRTVCAPGVLQTHSAFIDHVASLNACGLGWVGVIVNPRQPRGTT